MLNTVIVIVTVLVTCYLIFSPRLSKSKEWKATVTPLASIMGSGFLVCAPILAGVSGVYAAFLMLGLLILAFFVGSAIRYNIEHFEPIEHKGGLIQDIAFFSRIVLAGAYFVSVTYYIQLLAAFSLSSFGIQNQTYSAIVATCLLSFLGIFGMTKGLQALEKLEKYFVSFNLGMIAALLVALALYNIELFSKGTWQLPTLSIDANFTDFRVLLGLLIVVQGFETSRYLGSEFPTQMRIASMRLAQIVSAIIYIIFISLATVLFEPGLGSDVTAILVMVKPVAIILPTLLAVAAVLSQFSAANADEIGASGLIYDISQGKLGVRYIYLLILCVTLFLTLGTDVNEIIAYASRAFALYYAVQCFVALLLAKEKGQTSKMVKFGMLSFICFLVFILGLPSG